jgi:hypothetical protein
VKEGGFIYLENTQQKKDESEVSPPGVMVIVEY